VARYRVFFVDHVASILPKGAPVPQPYGRRLRLHYLRTFVLRPTSIDKAPVEPFLGTLYFAAY
jgi:hypothetical protein